MSNVVINEAIIADPAICHGQPVFHGTRIMVWQVLELLKSGATKKEIRAAYPSLPKMAIESALSYAAAKVREASYVPFSSEPHTHHPHTP